MKSAMGIDPGYAKAAVCVLRDGKDHDVWLLPTKRRPDFRTVQGRMRRYAEQIYDILRIVHQFRPSFILLESYAYDIPAKEGEDRPPSNTHQYTAEYGGVLRWELTAVDYAPGPAVIEVAPVQLKKFCRGIGRGSKDEMIESIEARWDVHFSIHDKYDAYGLARMAAVMAGHAPPETDADKEAIEGVWQSKANRC